MSAQRKKFSCQSLLRWHHICSPSHWCQESKWSTMTMQKCALALYLSWKVRSTVTRRMTWWSTRRSKWRYQVREYPNITFKSFYPQLWFCPYQLHSSGLLIPLKVSLTNPSIYNSHVPMSTLFHVKIVIAARDRGLFLVNLKVKCP